MVRWLLPETSNDCFIGVSNVYTCICLYHSMYHYIYNIRGTQR